MALARRLRSIGRDSSARFFACTGRSKDACQRASFSEATQNWRVDALCTSMDLKPDEYREAREPW